MIRRMHPGEFPEIFDIMERSFPPDERRPYDEQAALLNDSRYSIYVPDDASAFIALWQFDDLAFVEHFAVDPDRRNGGIGSRMLRELISMLPYPLFLEVEPPEEELQRRRIGFYERCGFTLNPYPYFQPPISCGKNTIPLMIMTSGGGVTEERYNQIRSLLYREVYKVGNDFLAKYFPNG